MNKSYALLRAIRGPILLILVGALFAVDHAGVFSVGQTWPFFLIVFGILRFLERSVAPPTPVVQYGHPQVMTPPPPPQPPYGGSTR